MKTFRALLGAALAAVLVFPATAAAAPADGWTGTWAASPQNTDRSFDSKTIRQVVRTSIGGDSARIQLSNAFGRTPLNVRNVHIALRSSGSGIVPGSDRRITFGGASSIVIPVGAKAISDPVAFAVPAGRDVAVSMFVPNSGPATGHQMGQQTNYIAPGDVSGNETLQGAETTGSYYFLANLDVRNPNARGAVVTLGASITDGSGSRFDGNNRWPNVLARRLAAANRQVGVLNQGISGNRLLADGAGQSALNRFERDVLAQPGVQWVIFSDDPINDLSSGKPPTGQQLVDGLRQLINRAHQAGVKFACSTLTPFEGASAWSRTAEQGRSAVNAFVRSANSGCDAVIDQDTATHDPARPTWILPRLDTGDHLHPNEAGLEAIANAVNLNIFN